MEILDSHDTATYDLVIAGDLNFHVNDDNNTEATQFSEILSTYNLTQFVQDPTHESGYTLDLVITRALPNFVRNVTVGEKISDHFAVKCQLALKKPGIEKKEVTFRKVNQIDFDKFNSDLCEKFKGFDQLCDINDLTASYNSTLREVLDEYAPEQTKVITVRNKHQGFSLDIRTEKKKRRQLERRWRRSKSAIDREEFIKQKEKVKQMLEDSDTEFYSNLVMENSGNSKILFNTLNKMLRKKNESQLPPHDSALQLADEFMEYFIAKIEKIQDFIDQTIAANDHECDYVEELKFKTPMSAFSMLSEANVSDLIIKSPATFCDLDPVPTWIFGRCQEIIVKIMTQIINKSLRSAVMPEDFKLALLIPLLKKVGLEVIKPNFRPVSNLPYASKMIERAVANQMVEHMKQNDLFEPLQSAYKEGHSTETALLKVQNDLLVAMDNQRVSILVLLDLSAAFDTVNHRLLLKRLNDRCGVVGDALKWFESYLTDRSQTVKVKNVTSKKMTLSCGVPQGSVLGPLLFLVYTLPLGDIMRKKGLQFHIYADDTQIYMSFTPNIDGISFSISRIEECIKDIEAWMMINRLKLNGDKTEMLIIGTNKQCRKLSNISITVGGSVIEASEKARNLGAVFDTNLTLKSHVSVVCKAASLRTEQLKHEVQEITIKQHS